MAGRGQCDLLEEGDIMARLPKKLREIIYNTRPRDEYSIGVYDPVPTGPRSCEYVFGGLGQADWFYCGRPLARRVDGTRSVYCEEHHELCYRGKSRKVKAVA